jgi:hypothetical protein
MPLGCLRESNLKESCTPWNNGHNYKESRDLVTGKRPKRLEFKFPFLIVALDTSPEQQHLDLRERIELKGNDVLADSELSVARELLQETLYDLHIAEETMSLVHIILILLMRS